MVLIALMAAATIALAADLINILFTSETSHDETFKWQTYL